MMLGAEQIPDRVQEEVPEMLNALIRSCHDNLPVSRKLWNNDPRANGIALEALAGSLTAEDPTVLRNVIAWFKEKQQRDGSFGTALETARVVQGLAQFAFSVARARGLDPEAARASVASAHQGLADAIPLAVLWQPMRWSHDEMRQARVLVVPDRIWSRTVWIVSALTGVVLVPLVYDLIKTWWLR